MQEIWPSGSDGTDINAACISPDQKYVATSDDFGQVSLFNYPVITKGAKKVVGNGHSSHVTNVRFALDGKRLISTGGNDKTVMIWKILEK